MRQMAGFTLIEILVFLVVTGLLLTTILLGATTMLRQVPNVHQQWEALQMARGCMEWFLDQRRLQGYDALACPSSPSTSLCPVASGYSLSADVACSTWNSDSAYKTITVSVSGKSAATLSMLIGEYE